MADFSFWPGRFRNIIVRTFILSLTRSLALSLSRSLALSLSPSLALLLSHLSSLISRLSSLFSLLSSLFSPLSSLLSPLSSLSLSLWDKKYQCTPDFESPENYFCLGQNISWGISWGFSRGPRPFWPQNCPLLCSGQFRGQKGLGPLKKPREMPH